MNDAIKPSSMRRTETPAALPEPVEPVAEKTEPALCPVCEKPLQKKDLFCSSCGFAVGAKIIVKLSDEDVRSFLFKGFISRQFELYKDILGDDCVKIKLRTLQDKDYRAINRHMSEYTAGQGGANKVLTDDFNGERRARCIAHSLVSSNGAAMNSVDEAIAHQDTWSQNQLSLVQDHYNALAKAIDGALASERRVKKL